MAAIAGEMVKLKALSERTYKEQAVWFMNAFWAGESGPQFGANEDQCENVWKYLQKAVEIDAKGEEGNELNEFDAHRLLEAFDSTLTVKDMREALKEIDVDFNKMVSLTEFMIHKFKVDWKVLVNAPQGEEDDSVKEARRLVEAAQAALQNVQATATKAKEEEEKATAAHEASVAEAARAAEEEREATGKEAEAKAAEDEAAKAKAAADAALAELTAQEEAFKAKMEKLEETSVDASLGIVKRNKAKAELAQLKCEDPLPLRQAKITQEAAVRKLQRALKKAASAAAAAGAARKNAETARVAAEEAAAAAEGAAKAAMEATAAAEAAIPVAEQAFEEAQTMLAEVQAKADSAGQGTFWFMDRELIEAMKYMPQKKREAMQKKMAAAKEERKS